ncbi:ABC transporter permease [Rhodoligotrophos defluvii]|uniref:ABC transporter permease n=1 Tax=Rhodoligotrophos defluvii TaxID=2561934 RepID=UPI0010C9A173|nr:ABC transporter permease [Rhodoligotrophos defluvii]
MAADAQARRLGPLALLVPLLLIMLGFYVWPLIQTVINSFHPYELSGIDFSRWTLENYARLADPFYLDTFLRTARISVMITLITCVLAYPVAIFITGLSKRAQALLLLVYMAPWLVNVVVKAFGWSLILSGNGVINRALRELGLIGAPLQLMFNETGIIIGLVQGHFLFVLLPLWAALSALDPRLKWAAENLGASRAQVFLRVTLPITLPALLAGAFINFTMNMAAFATPALLGGSRARVISFVAYEVNLIELNWPFGGALAMALLIATLIPIWLSRRLATMRQAKLREA